MLFSEQIEEYVPDGISISHPVLDMRDGHLVDCLDFDDFEKDCSFSALISGRVGCSGGLTMIPS